MRTLAAADGYFVGWHGPWQERRGSEGGEARSGWLDRTGQGRDTGVLLCIKEATGHRFRRIQAKSPRSISASRKQGEGGGGEPHCAEGLVQ